MAQVNCITNSNLIQILEEIRDFRNPGKIIYQLNQVLMITIVACIAGVNHSSHKAEFAKCHKQWFKFRLGMDKLPSDDTIERILNLVSRRDLECALQLKNLRKSIKIDGEN